MGYNKFRRNLLINGEKIPLTYSERKSEFADFQSQIGSPEFVAAPLTSAKTILFVGSSSEADRGASTVDDGIWMTDARVNGYMKIAADYCRDELGHAINITGNFGNQANTTPGLAGYTAYDPSVTFDTSGISFSTIPTIGGNGFNIAAGAGGAGRWIQKVFPAGSDTIEFYSCTSAAGAANGNRMQYNIDGGSYTDITFANANVVKTTISGLNKSVPHTLRMRGHISGLNANTVQTLGWRSYDSTLNELRFVFGGARAWNTTTTYWTSTGNTFNPMSLLARVVPNILIEAFGGNEDFTTDGSLASFITRCGTFHDAAVATGAKTACLIKPFRYAGAKAPGDFYSEYEIRDARIAFAKSRGIPYLDMSESSGPYNLATANGELWSDGLHYKIPWHSRVGTAVGYWLHTSGLIY